MNYKYELLNLGFTKQEMDEFIFNKYEEYVKEKQVKESINKLKEELKAHETN